MPRDQNAKQNTAFAGTESGSVRLYHLNAGADGKFGEHLVHSKAVTRMRITTDGQYLLSVSEDGSLAQFSIDSKGSRERASREHLLPPAEEILVAKADLEQKMALIQDLQSKVEDLQNHNELQLQLREMKYRERYRDVTQKFLNEMQIDKTRYQALEDEKAAMKRHFALQMAAHNAGQEQSLQELVKHFNAKMKSEVKRYEELKRMQEELHQQWTMQEDNTLFKNEQEIRDAEEKYSQQLSNAKDAREKLQEMVKQIMKDKDEMQQALEADVDMEVGDLTTQFEQKLTEEWTNTRKLKEENSLWWRKIGNLFEESRTSDGIILQHQGEVAALESKIHTLEKDIQSLLKEIKERESTIADKHHRIFELQKKNQELEKFKFVLDYKISELVRLIKPKKEQMAKLGTQIGAMDNELKKYNEEGLHLTLTLKKLDLKLNGMEKEIRQTTRDREAVNASLARFKTDLHETYLHLDDAKELKAYTKRLYQRHVVNSNKAASKQGTADVHKDYQRQRKFLEKSVDSLQNKLGKDMLVHKKENMRITKENIALIREINELRREIAILRNAQKLKDQSKSAARAARLDAFAHASGNRRREIEDEITRQQEQIRALKAQIETYQRMASEERGTQNRPGSSTLPPLPKANRASLQSREGGSRQSARQQQLQPL